MPPKILVVQGTTAHGGRLAALATIARDAASVRSWILPSGPTTSAVGLPRSSRLTARCGMRMARA